jgi:hypothetical protein
MRRDSPQIDEPIQGLMPIWELSPEAQADYRTRLLMLRHLKHQGKIDKSRLLHASLKLLLHAGTIASVAKRIEEAKELSKEMSLERSPMVTKLLFLSRIQLVQAELLPYATDALGYMATSEKDRLSRLVRHPEEFISQKKSN